MLVTANNTLVPKVTEFVSIMMSWCRQTPDSLTTSHVCRLIIESICSRWLM